MGRCNKMGNFVATKNIYYQSLKRVHLTPTFPRYAGVGSIGGWGVLINYLSGLSPRYCQ